MNSSINSKYIQPKTKEIDVEEYVHKILSGDRVFLSKAITLTESTKEEHREKAGEIVEKCLPFSGKSIRIGITGIPGVGKSTFIDNFGAFLVDKGKKLAVLAIDPSSVKTGGSILGDKTRMEKLTLLDEVYVRPSPSGGNLGGVAKSTHEAIILCEAAGFDTIFVETVGVGQSEIVVNYLVDFFLLLIIAGAGDELQGIKRGIMEMADAVLINKADGENLEKSKNAKAEFTKAMHYFSESDSGWSSKVEICSATTGFNLDKVWDIIKNYETYSKANNYFNKKREEQNAYWLYQTIEDELKNKFYHNNKVIDLIKKIEKEVKSNMISSFEAGKKIIKIFTQNNK